MAKRRTRINPRIGFRTGPVFWSFNLVGIMGHVITGIGALFLLAVVAIPAWWAYELGGTVGAVIVAFILLAVIGWVKERR